MRGTIKTLVPNRGFGFITVTNDRDYFFHLSGLTNRKFEQLRLGDQVEFILGTDPKTGRLAAEQVNVV
jgi:cold shock CspA family protein